MTINIMTINIMTINIMTIKKAATGAIATEPSTILTPAASAAREIAVAFCRQAAGHEHEASLHISGGDGGSLGAL